MSKFGDADAEKSPYFSVLHHFEEYNAELIFSNANLQNLISFKRFQARNHVVDAEVEKTEKELHHNDYSTCKPWPSHVKTFEGNAYNPGNAYKEKERLEKTSLDGGAYGARTGQNKAGMQQLQGKEDTPSVSVFKVYSKHITLMGKRESQSAFLFLAILFFLAPI